MDRWNPHTFRDRKVCSTRSLHLFHIRLQAQAGFCYEDDTKHKQASKKIGRNYHHKVHPCYHWCHSPKRKRKGIIYLTTQLRRVRYTIVQWDYRTRVFQLSISNPSAQDKHYQSKLPKRYWQKRNQPAESHLLSWTVSKKNQHQKWKKLI